MRQTDKGGFWRVMLQAPASMLSPDGLQINLAQPSVCVRVRRMRSASNPTYTNNDRLR